MRLLVVDDDAHLAALLRRALVREGHAVETVGCGAEALWLVEEEGFDAVILDVNLPDLDGFKVCRQLRQQGSAVKVLLLSARDEVRDRVAGLDAGADDYLPKPFELAELTARLRALDRRSADARPPVIVVGDLEIDTATRGVRRRGGQVDLTAQEFALLELLARRPGTVVSRAAIRDHLWDFAVDGADRLLDTAVLRLRQKVDRPFDEALIETVRGVGYRLRV